MNCFKAGNKARCEINSDQAIKANEDPNNNANAVNPEKSQLKNGGNKKEKSPAKLKKVDKNETVMEEIKMKVGKMLEEDVITKVEEKVIHELQNTNRYRQYINKQHWRESVQSLKSIDHIFKLGESKSGLNSNYAGAPQDYQQLHDQCLRDGQLFEDSSFPATDQSFYLHGRGTRKFKWLRPHEIVNDPLFISQGAHRFDVCQGELGNCWFLAAVANLTMNDKYFQRVVPSDQTFDKSDYAGIFHFRFWQYGKWIDVVIDDKLPTVNGQLMMMHSKDQNEFWSALLEKAYAKLHGSYESLKGGTTSEAMEDFTGGLTEHYEIQTEECPGNLCTIMYKAHQRGSFMGCSISAADASQMEAVLPNGLIKGHAYSITSMKMVQIDHFKVQGKIPLIRIRNPWGNEAEWNGAWSDKSREWSVVSDEEKRQLGLMFDADGEFWMSYADFKKNFTNIEITNLTPDSLDEDQKRHWEVNYFEGQWIPGVSAGGCRNNLETFQTNPQYMITLVDIDEDDDEHLCTCVVALMQKNHRIKRKMGLDNLTVGFAIYEVKDNTFGLMRQHTAGQHQVLNTNFFRYNASVARSATFINLREVSGRFRLKPGRYCIIPSTFEPNQKGEFIIRFFTEKPAKNVMENDEEVGAVQEEDEGGDNKENGMDIVNGPAIDEHIIGDYRPDPDPIRDDNTNINFTEAINACLSLLCLAKQCYEDVSSKPEVVSLLAASAPQTETTTDRSSAEKSAYELFQKISGDDLEIDAFELQKLMNHVFKKELKFDGFSLESCRSMIALTDSDESGKLGFDEFIQLWRHMRTWAEIFKKHDANNSNTISAGELKAAFHEVGININRQILRLLVNRYGHHSKESSKVEDELYFDDFVCCALKMKRCIEVWNSKRAKAGPFPGGLGAQFGGTFSLLSRAFDTKLVNESSFTLDEFIRQVLYS